MSLLLSFLFLATIASGSLQDSFECKDLSKIFRRTLDCPNQNPVGEGPTASVYLVQDEHKNQFAAKVMSFDTKVKLENREMLKQESSLLQQVADHSHVIQLIDLKEEPSAIYFLMEFGANGSLEDYAISHPELVKNPFFMLKMIEGIAKGVEEIHRLGFAVADLKPENVILMADLTPKIIDLGFAQPMTNNPDAMVCGSPLFIDPRMYSSAPSISYDPKVDVYSFGTLLYTLVARAEADLPTRIRDLHSVWIFKDYKIPSGTEKTIVQLIEKCRQLNASLRPTFQEIGRLVKAALKQAEFTVVAETSLNTQSLKTWTKTDFIREKQVSKSFQNEYERAKAVSQKKSVVKPVQKSFLSEIQKFLCIKKGRKRVLLQRDHSDTSLVQESRQPGDTSVLLYLCLSLAMAPTVLAIIVVASRRSMRAKKLGKDKPTPKVELMDTVEQPEEGPTDPKLPN